MEFFQSLPVKLIAMVICSVLFWWGGYSWKPARRFCMPFICVLMAYLATINVCVGVCMLLAILPLCLGYGDDSYLKHVFGNGWGRGVWGLLVAICLSTPLVLTHHLGLEYGLIHIDSDIFVYIVYIAYMALNFTLENALKNIPQFIGDPLIGLGFSSILLLIR